MEVYTEKSQKKDSDQFDIPGWRKLPDDPRSDGFGRGLLRGSGQEIRWEISLSQIRNLGTRTEVPWLPKEWLLFDFGFSFGDHTKN
jgi:hypothetical protein